MSLRSRNRGKESRDVFELVEAITTLGRVLSSGPNKTSAMPIGASSRLLEGLRAMKTSLATFFDAAQPSYDSLVVTHEDDESDGIRDAFEPTPEHEYNPTDDVPVGVESGSEEDAFEGNRDYPDAVARVMSRLPLQKFLIRAGMDFSTNRAKLARQSEINNKSHVMNVFHMDALIRPDLDNTYIAEQAKNHLLQRIKTISLSEETRADALVIRSALPIDKASAELKRAILAAAGPSLQARAQSYLRRAVILVEPEGLIKPSHILSQLELYGKLNQSGEWRLDVYTPVPDEIDSTDNLVRFIVYALMDHLRVIPVLQRLESERATAIHA